MFGMALHPGLVWKLAIVMHQTWRSGLAMQIQLRCQLQAAELRSARRKKPG